VASSKSGQNGKTAAPALDFGQVLKLRLGVAPNLT